LLRKKGRHFVIENRPAPPAAACAPAAAAGARAPLQSTILSFPVVCA